MVGDACRPLHTFSHFIAYRPITWILLIIILFAYLSMDAFKNTIENHFINIQKVGRGALAVLILLVFSGFIYFSWMNTKQALDTFENYFRYNNAWGTGRGLIWNRLVYSFTQSPFTQLLFGHGLDTTRFLLINTFGESMAMYDNAHNEILQYLVTTGIVGLLLYLSIFITCIKRLWKFVKKEPYACALGATVVCYLIQSIVNINQPITTPLLFMFLGMIESFIRQESY